MIEKLVTFLNEVVCIKPLFYCLLITGLIFTFRMRFFQVIHFKEIIILIFKLEKYP
ncbi:sodium:alanine symporter family protein, partial [Staphylococcus sp. 7810]